MIVPMFHTLRTRPIAFSSSVEPMSQYMRHLTHGFQLLSQCTENIQAQLNGVRNSLRDMLNSADADQFPRRGRHAVSVFDILHAVYGSSSVEGVGDILCSLCLHSQLAGPPSARPLGHCARDSNVQILHTLHRTEFGTGNLARSSISFDDWLSAFSLNCVPLRIISSLPPSCAHCSLRAPRLFKFHITVARPLFFVDVSAWKISTSARLSLVFTTVDGWTVSYHLCGAIYHGQNHWASRWITREGQVWGHDGQLHRGKLMSHGKARADADNADNSEGCFLGSFQQKTLSLLIYAIDY